MIRQMATPVSIAWPGGVVGGRLAGAGPEGILLAHGAGTNQDHPSLVALRDRLADAGHLVMTFNYPYSEAGRRSPDRRERLLECHRAAAEQLREQVTTLVLAGRSMGGRMATYLVADGLPASGLVLCAYPLHPAGKPDRLRADHLGDVGAPMLFFQGTKDPLSRMDLFDTLIRPLPGVEVEIMEGAGHSLAGGGWAPESSVEHIAAVTSSWIRRLPSGRSDAGGQ